MALRADWESAACNAIVGRLGNLTEVPGGKNALAVRDVDAVVYSHPGEILAVERWLAAWEKCTCCGSPIALGAREEHHAQNVEKCICVYVCVCVCVYVYVYMCLCVCIYIYIYIYI